MTPFPEIAEPIRQAIRKEVPKPVKLPKMVGNRLRWRCKFPRFDYLLTPCLTCAMGLLPYAKSPTPATATSLSWKHENTQVLAMAKWWDRQTDAKAAVDAVWGK